MTLAESTPPAESPITAPPAAAPTPAGYTFDILEHSAIVPSLTNPRKHFDPAALAQLADSIKAEGLGQPILVRPLPGSRVDETFVDRRSGDPRPTHEIVAGERRWRAAKLAGMRAMPVTIRQLTDLQVLRMQLTENVQRKDLHELEVAQGYRRILDLPDDADRKMAERLAELAGQIGKSERHVYQSMQLLKLCDFAQKVFLEGKLRKMTALPIATIGNEAQQIEATRRIAGLARTGTSTDVVETPMHQRDAEQYVRDNFRLLLSKAPFPVKVVYAGIEACTTCPKMSANVPGNFEEGSKVPDTCMDPSCYGKKNGAHTSQLAAAAKAKGQRVISGKEAKKHLPHESMPEHLTHSSEYQSLDERLYSEVEPKHSGKTVAQLLGDDMPAPVLIERPDGKGFVKALPTKDVKRLLQEKGVARSNTNGRGQVSEAEKKAQREKAARWVIGAKVLDAVATGPKDPAHATQLQASVASSPAQAALLSALLVRVGVRMFCDLDNDASNRVRKILGWNIERAFRDNDGKVQQHFQALDAVEFNRFVVAALISGELHCTEYVKTDMDHLVEIGQLVGVDAKALREQTLAEAKAAATKKSPAKTAKRVSTKPSPAPTKQRTKGADPAASAPAPAQQGDLLESSIPVWLDEEGISVGDFRKLLVPGARVRVRNLQDGLPQSLEAHQGREGVIASQSGPESWMVSFRTAGSNTTTSRAFNEADLMASQIQLTPAAIEVGQHVRVRHGLRGPTGHFRKTCGRKGVVAKVLQHAFVVKGLDERGPGSVYRATELEIFEADRPAATDKEKPATQAVKPTDGVKLAPQPAWPFPGNNSKAAKQ